MSAGKNRPSRQSYRVPRRAAVTSAVVGAEVPYGGGRSPGASLWVGAAPGCQAVGGAEAQGGWAK